MPAPGPRPLLAVLLLLLGVAAPPARGDAVPVAVLGLDAVDVPTEEAQALTDALRQRLGGAPGVRLVPGKELVEMKLIFGCMDERPACLAQAGKSLGAERVIFGSVRKPAASAGRTVVLKQLLVPAARIEKFISDTVPARALVRGPELEGLADRWTGVLVTGALTGGLQIGTDPPGASVVLDGKSVGKTPLELRDVQVGTHVVSIALPGYDQVVRSFAVQGGLVHDIQAQLRRRSPAQLQPALPPALAGRQAPARPPDPGRPYRIASYFLIGAAAIAGGVSIYTWRTYTGAQEAAGAAATDLRGALDMSGMNLPASPEVNAFFQSSERLSSCEPPQELTVRAMATPESRAAFQGYLDQCRRGRTYADATTGLLATMGSLALVGVTSYIISRTLQPGAPKSGPDDAYKAKQARSEKPSWLYRPRLTEISPAAYRSGGGLNLSFQF